MFRATRILRCQSRSVDVLANGLLSGNRSALAKAITLIESSRSDHQRDAQELLNRVTMADKSFRRKFAYDNTFRIGIAGPPGAGKSTFIEALGLRLISKNHRVAVIPVDPSSHLSGGSILGDKTRMEHLCKEDNAYIRASPSRGVLGGIAEHTSDVITLCEAANFDVVLIESVGLGQSEVDIDIAVDMVLIVVPPGSGDGLQASKKGIMEAADLVLVNKADGHLLDAAKHTKADYSGAMHFIRQKNKDWRASVLLMSASTGSGMDEVEHQLREFHRIMSQNHYLLRKRSNQYEAWMWNQFRRQLIDRAEKSNEVIEHSEYVLSQVRAQHISPSFAAGTLVDKFLRTTQTTNDVRK